MKPILINGAFRGQTITGQQRYASEVSRCLVEAQPGLVVERVPRAWWSRSPIRAWVWSQSVGRGRRRNEMLLTLTSRGPLAARRHVVVIHDLFVITHPEWFSRMYAWTHIPVLWVQIWTAQVIVTVSDPVADEVRKLTKGKKAVIVAPNAPADVFANSASTEFELETHTAKFGLERGKFILTVGSLDPRKNLERLVEAHRKLPESVRSANPLVIVGARNTTFGRVSVFEDPDTRLLGYVSDDELAALYSSSRLVAFPTLDEGFGLPAVEALAVGARILVSDIPVMRWVCEDYASYVDPLSVDSISAGLMKELESNVDLPLHAKESRRDYVNSRFSWTRSAEAIISGLESRPSPPSSESMSGSFSL